jgi:TPR repeat protein
MRGKSFSGGALLDNKNNKKGMPQSLRCSNGEHHMADQTPRYRSYDYEVDTRDKSLIERRVAPYKFGPSARTDSHAEEPVPLFLSDYDGEPDPSEYMTPLRKDRRGSLSSRILAGVLAIAAVGILFAMFSSDVTRDIIVNAKASIAASLPAPYAATKPDSAQLTASDTQLKNPKDAARVSAPASQTPAVRSVTTVAVTPTREEITTAYQSALQSRAPAATAPAAAVPVAAPPVAASPARRLEADELAALMKRAKGLIAIGDIASARLLLERAADAQEASAALLLAQTYDPVVLGAQDTRSITPDPAAARAWYQKAAQLGSSDATQRLAQMQK